MSLAVGQVFAGYTILRILGGGGMGHVYLASHPRLPRKEALKVLRRISPMTPSIGRGLRVRPTWRPACLTHTSSRFMTAVRPTASLDLDGVCGRY